MNTYKESVLEFLRDSYGDPAENHILLKSALLRASQHRAAFKKLKILPSGTEILEDLDEEAAKWLKEHEDELLEEGDLEVAQEAYESRADERRGLFGKQLFRWNEEHGRHFKMWQNADWRDRALREFELTGDLRGLPPEAEQIDIDPHRIVTYREYEAGFPSRRTRQGPRFGKRVLCDKRGYRYRKAFPGNSKWAVVQEVKRWVRDNYHHCKESMVRVQIPKRVWRHILKGQHPELDSLYEAIKEEVRWWVMMDDEARHGFICFLARLQGIIMDTQEPEPKKLSKAHVRAVAWRRAWKRTVTRLSKDRWAGPKREMGAATRLKMYASLVEDPPFVTFFCSYDPVETPEKIAGFLEE